MDLVAVMNQVGDAVDTITDLNVYRFPVDSLSPPAAIVQFPTINYDRAFQRGLDRMEGGIVVLVSRVWDEAARNAIAPYVDGSGSNSVHAALHAYTTGKQWTTCHYARVTRVSFPSGGYTVGDVPYVGAQFDLDIAGGGS